MRRNFQLHISEPNLDNFQGVGYGMSGVAILYVEIYVLYIEIFMDLNIFMD